MFLPKSIRCWLDMKKAATAAGRAAPKKGAKAEAKKKAKKKKVEKAPSPDLPFADVTLGGEFLSIAQRV